MSGTELLTNQPFIGLRPFDYKDRAFFFGRSKQTYALYGLIEYGFIAVIGSSGSGKSSLVRAGLFPLLRDDTSGESWSVAVMTPGTTQETSSDYGRKADSPISRLADAVAGLGPPDEDPADRAIRRDRVEHLLRRSSSGLADALDELPNLTGRNVLIVVDQFEEIFRYASSGPNRDRVGDAQWRDEAASFVQLLLGLYRYRNTAHALITMRSDFIGNCAQFPDLPEAVSDTQFLVPSLSRAQREEAIRGPIDKVDASIEPALVERLLNDVGYELDQLPVLQHCLLRMWNRASKRPGKPVLTEADYNDVGKMDGALSQHANEVMRDLPGLETTVEQIFRALSERDRDGRATRRAIKFRQLVDETGMPEANVRRVVDRFRAADCSFLLPSIAAVPMLTDETRVDVVHEALLRRWERITSPDPSKRGWLDDEDEDGSYYRSLLARIEGGEMTLPLDRVKERYDWWTSRPRTTAWAERYGGEHARVEQFFADSLAALEKHDQDERKAKEREQELLLSHARDADLRAKAARRFGLISGAIAIVALASMIAAAAFAINATQARNALTKTVATLSAEKVALTQEKTVATSAETKADIAAGKAKKSAIAASKSAAAATKSAAGEKRATIAEKAKEREALVSAQKAENATLAERDAKLGALELEKQANASASALRSQLAQSFIQYAPTVEAQNDPEDAVRLLAAAYLVEQDPSLQFELAQAISLSEIGIGPTSTGGDTTAAMAIRPNSAGVATGNKDGTVDYWDNASSIPRRLSCMKDPVTVLAFDPSGSVLAVGRSDGAGQLLDPAKGSCALKAIALTGDNGVNGHVGSLDALAFSRDGAFLLTGGEDGQLKLWCVRATARCPRGHLVTVAPTSNANAAPIISVAFTNDDVPVALRGDGSVGAWHPTTGVMDPPLRRPDGMLLSDFAASPDGSKLAAAVQGGTVWLYDLRSRRQVPIAWSGAITALRFDPSGRMLAVAAGDGTVRFFESATGVEKSPCAALPLKPAVNAIAFSAAPAELVASYDDGTVQVRDVADGCRVVDQRKLGSSAGPYLAIAPHADFLAATGKDGRLRRWTLPPASSFAPAANFGGPLQAMAFDASGHHMASLNRDGKWEVWNSPGAIEGSASGSFTSADANFAIVRLSEDGKELALADRDHVELWNLATKTRITIQKKQPSEEISDVEFAGNTVLVAQRSVVQQSADGWWRYDLRGRLLDSEAVHEASLKTLYPLGNSGRLVGLSLFGDDAAVFDDLATGARLHTRWINVDSVAPAPNGALVAMNATGGWVALFAPSGAQLGALTPSVHDVTGMALSADGQWLGLTNAAGQAEIWNVADRAHPQFIERLPADGAVNSLAFDPSGPRLVLTTTTIGNVQLWDRDSPTALRTETPCGTGLFEAHFAASGKIIVAACSDGALKEWPLTQKLPYTQAQLAALLSCYSTVEYSDILIQARDLIAAEGQGCRER